MHQPSHASSMPKTVHVAALLRTLILVASVLSLISAVALPDTRAEGKLPPFQMDPGLPPDIVLNGGQGLGQCHWLDNGILSNPSVSWAYDSSETISAWSAIEPQDGVYNWAPLDVEIAKARALDKQVWLELHTSEGQTPQWARDAGIVVIGSRGGAPIPWSETYQRLLRRTVHAMAARYDDDATVDAVNVAAGGCYGEMTICSSPLDRDAWEQAGYTDERFIETVKEIIDIYLEAEYAWEDGTRTHGFLKTPVVLQLGSGLYGHTLTVIPPVVDYAVNQYGMRVWLKYNGLGGEHDMGWLYEEYAALTRVGYEPSGNSLQFLMKPKEYIQAALDQHSSFLCLQKTYFDVSDSNWLEARDWAARYLGAQIIIQGIDAPHEVVAGDEYPFVTQWVNRGTTPLMAATRAGPTDVPTSFDILLAFVDAATGSTVLERTFRPQPSTTEWQSAQPVRIEQSIRISEATPPGTYDLRLGLVDPGLAADDPQRWFRLVNVDLHDGEGRYTMGQIMVSSGALPTAAPAPTVESTPIQSPAPPEGENWLARLLRSIWTWLLGLVERLG